MTINIVTLNVSTTNPPKPSKLLKSGAFISQGATTTDAGTLSLLTTSDSLSDILAGGLSISALVWATGTVTVTTTENHGIDIGDTVDVVITGCVPTGYNVTGVTATSTGAKTMTYPLVTNPGVATTFGTLSLSDVIELNQMNTTYWAQGSNAPVYVLELGAGSDSAAVEALDTWIKDNPNTIFAYLVPRSWDSEATFKTLASAYTSPTSLTKFFVTTTESTYSAWTGTYSNVLAMVESPNKPDTEFSLASTFYDVLNWTPGSATQVPPLCFCFEYDVTEYPITGNSTLLNTLKDANVNYISTAAEGGLSNKMVVWGRMMDGNPYNYWYTVAWAIINIDLDLSNEIINGSNNVLAPLYYNQKGIDRLQGRAAKTLRNGVSYGLILGQVIMTQLDPQTFASNVADGVYAGNAVINAVPFTTYNQENPSDYALGKYAGFQIALTPARGFEQIVVNLNVTNFVA